MKSGPALRTAIGFLFVCGLLYLIALWLESKVADIKAAERKEKAAAGHAKIEKDPIPTRSPGENQK